MFFGDKYSVTTTTNLNSIEPILGSMNFDLLVIDDEPDKNVEELCRRLNEKQPCLPIILTYVYTIKYRENEVSLKNFIEAIFYKPIDLFEVAQKIDRMMYQLT
jgi:DNA-binding response OmpR family regulator